MDVTSKNLDALWPPQTRKRRFQECFLGAQTSGKQCFLSAKNKKHCTENKRLRRLNLRNAAHATLKSTNVVNIVSSVRKRGKNVYYRSKKCFRNKCFVCAQTGKHLGKHASATFPCLQGLLYVGLNRLNGPRIF